MEEMKWIIKKYGICFLLALSLTVIGCIVWEKKEAVYPAGSRGVKVPFVQIDSQEQIESGDGAPYAYTEPECVLLMDEQQKLQNSAVSAAEMCAGFYSAVESVNDNGEISYASTIELTEQQRKDIINLLGDNVFIPCIAWGRMHRSQYTSPLRMEHFLPERLSVGRGYCKPTILGLDGRKTGYRL